MKKQMTFLDHLEELRKAIFKTLWVFLLIFAVSAYYSKSLFIILQRPLLPYLSEKSFFIATTAASGWVVYLQTAFMIALILILPFLLLQIFLFVNPALTHKEKLWIWPVALFFIVFFYVGIAFAYFLALPYGYAFLIEIYADSNIHFLPHIADYLGFTLTFLLAFGVMFDLPFVMLMLTATRLLSSQRLRKIRPYFYVVAFIVAAILTPPDYISQTFMAIPLILLFELGVLLGFIFGRKKKQ